MLEDSRVPLEALKLDTRHAAVAQELDALRVELAEEFVPRDLAVARLAPVLADDEAREDRLPLRRDDGVAFGEYGTVALFALFLAEHELLEERAQPRGPADEFIVDGGDALLARQEHRL